MPAIIRQVGPLLGTLVEIGLRGGEAELPQVFRAVFARMEHIHQRMSAHAADSDLAEISREAHRRFVTVKMR